MRKKEASYVYIIICIRNKINGKLNNIEGIFLEGKEQYRRIHKLRKIIFNYLKLSRFFVLAILCRIKTNSGCRYLGNI